MLRGEYSHTIDAKGRLMIPMKLRESLGVNFVITRGLDGCLFIYPENEWNTFEQKLRSLPLTNENARKFTRFFLGNTPTEGLDKQGRVLIPSTLRDYAKLDKEVVVVGMINRIEIWDRTRWEGNNADVEENMNDIAAQLDVMGLGI